MDNEKTFDHPSYGMVQFSRRQGNPRLFASALDTHQHYVTLSIRKCQLIRGDHGDRYYGSIRGDLVEVDMSAAQFAELLTTMNVGMGVPCTVNYLNGQKVVAPPVIPTEAQSVRDGFKESLAEFAKGLPGKAKKVREILEKKALNKEDRAQVASVIDSVIREMTDRAPFIVDMFREATERVMTAAKAEADAWLTGVVHRAGMKALAEAGGLPELPGKAKEPDCNCYKDCHEDSQSGNWHQHEGEPCLAHPNAPMVG